MRSASMLACQPVGVLQARAGQSTFMATPSHPAGPGHAALLVVGVWLMMMTMMMAFRARRRASHHCAYLVDDIGCV